MITEYGMQVILTGSYLRQKGIKKADLQAALPKHGAEIGLLVIDNHLRPGYEVSFIAGTKATVERYVQNFFTALGIQL